MFVVFATPFFKSDTAYFIEGMLSIEGLRLGIISQESAQVLPERIRSRLATHIAINDPVSADEITYAADQMKKAHGPIHRILAINEQVQLPVAEARSRLDVEGMMPEKILNFRDKARMKERFRAHGVPCARHCAATNEKEAWTFVEKVGFPVCVKPVDGAAAQSTYRVESADAFKDVLRASAPSWGHPIQIEEFVTGDEHSFESVTIKGERVWHSLTRYIPTPLDVMRNPWIQWRVILPREIEDPRYDDIREVSLKAIKALGIETALSHLEWFRRSDGSIAVGEVGARPPGAQIVTLMNRANDLDLYTQWARLMILDQFDPPKERKFACGAAFLRGLGSGRVKAVHGLDWVVRQLGDVITDVLAPQPGQPSAITYEGEGYILVKHPETRVVEEALEQIIANVRVELVS